MLTLLPASSQFQTFYPLATVHTEPDRQHILTLTPLDTRSSDQSEVCQLNHPTLRFVPAKARPAFARALSSTLKDILLHNTEESWSKLFMLPKSVLPFLKQKGVTNPHTPIESLCKLWLDNDLKALWAMANNRANDLSSTKGHLTSNNTKQTVSSAVSLGQAGLLGKACQILLPNGTAPITDTTLHLL